MDVCHNPWIFKVVVPRDGPLLQCTKSSTHKQCHHRQKGGYVVQVIRSNLLLRENILLRWRPIKGFRFNLSLWGTGMQPNCSVSFFSVLYSLLGSLLNESSLLVLFIFLSWPESWVVVSDRCHIVAMHQDSEISLGACYCYVVQVLLEWTFFAKKKTLLTWRAVKGFRFNCYQTLSFPAFMFYIP